MTNEQWMMHSPDESELYMKCINGLPDFWGISRDGNDTNGVRMELGSGAHIIKHLKRALDIVKPKNILEIGTNVGYGSAIMLELCDANVISIDISNREETLLAAKELKRRSGEKFDFYLRYQSGWKRKQFYKLCFIDGGHDEANATNDIAVCVEMNIPYLLFDDVVFQEGVSKAISKFPKLKLIEDMYNIKLFKYNYE